MSFASYVVLNPATVTVPMTLSGVPVMMYQPPVSESADCIIEFTLMTLASQLKVKSKTARPFAGAPRSGKPLTSTAIPAVAEPITTSPTSRAIVFPEFTSTVVAVVTISVTPGLVIPPSEAVITVVPSATEVARPEVSMVATLVLELVQVTSLVISIVGPAV
ncbi:hypothetical protein ES703_93081 [subsurface metagenome]